MNETLQQFARQTLKDQLALCTEAQQRKFRLMYGRAGGRRTVGDTEAMTINDVVEEIPAERLDWAMQQVQNTIKKDERQQPT